MARKQRATVNRRGGIYAPMQVVKLENGEYAYACWYCGEFVLEGTGVYCSACDNVICNSCLAENPILKVQVNENGPDYKKYEFMCSRCAERWRKLNPKQVSLDGFIQA